MQRDSRVRTQRDVCPQAQKRGLRRNPPDDSLIFDSCPPYWDLSVCYLNSQPVLLCFSGPGTLTRGRGALWAALLMMSAFSRVSWIWREAAAILLLPWSDRGAWSCESRCWWWLAFVVGDMNRCVCTGPCAQKLMDKVAPRGLWEEVWKWSHNVKVSSLGKILKQKMKWKIRMNSKT